MISQSSRIILKSGMGRRNFQKIDIVKIISEWFRLKTRINPDLNMCFKTKLEKGTIMADLLINEVFNNLLSNSIKYKKKEEKLNIEISLFQLKQLDLVPKPFIKSPNYYIIKFKDNGIGMSDNLKLSLFKPFKRGRKGTNNVPGLGLGLAIVRSIIGSYDGFIWVEDSEIGRPDSGVTFLIGIPITEK